MDGLVVWVLGVRTVTDHARKHAHITSLKWCSARSYDVHDNSVVTRFAFCPIQYVYTPQVHLYDRLSVRPSVQVLSTVVGLAVKVIRTGIMYCGTENSISFYEINRLN